MSCLSRKFTLREFKAIQVLREQLRDQMYFDDKGQPIKEKLIKNKYYKGMQSDW